VQAVPRLFKFYPGICLTVEEKAQKNPSQGKENLIPVKKYLSQSKNLSHACPLLSVQKQMLTYYAFVYHFV
jgi:hypothetical protein